MVIQNSVEKISEIAQKPDKENSMYSSKSNCKNLPLGKSNSKARPISICQCSMNCFPSRGRRTEESIWQTPSSLKENKDRRFRTGKNDDFANGNGSALLSG